MTPTRRHARNAPLLATVGLSGTLLGLWAGHGLAQRAVPTEHAGLDVSTLGVVDAASMERQLGLAGHRLQLREITIEPGGQIAKHGHEGRPGLVWMRSGTWTEGRPDGERDYVAGSGDTIVEDADTVHWFWNTGDEPATALVCDIVPAT